jgi:hypothetical protein
MTMRSLTIWPRKECVLILHGVYRCINIFQHWKYTVSFGDIYIIRVSMSSMITIITFELKIYAAFGVFI